MSEEPDSREARMAEAVRRVVTRRERAPRSPRLERAFKRLIWRYTQDRGWESQGVPDGPEGEDRTTDTDQTAHGA